MDAQTISIYQEMSKLFLGIQLSEITPLLQNGKNSCHLEENLQKDHYYILQKTDTKFGEKFKSNLKLSRNTQDTAYLEYLENLLQEVNPSLANQVNLESKSLDLENLTVKRTPKIIAKSKSIGGNKTGGTNKNVNYVDYCPKKYQISQELMDFLPRLGLKKEKEIDIPTVKQAMNSYISRHNLQSTDDRTHFKLDKNLRELFKISENESGNFMMSYAKLKIKLGYYFIKD